MTDKTEMLALLKRAMDKLDCYYKHTAGEYPGGEPNQILFPAIREALAEQPAGAVGEATFAEWLATEMPAGTVIGDPQWWANRIARQYRVRSAAQPAASVDGDDPLDEITPALCAAEKEPTDSAGRAKGEQPYDPSECIDKCGSDEPCDKSRCPLPENAPQPAEGDGAVAWQVRIQFQDGRWSGWSQSLSEHEAIAQVGRYGRNGITAEYRSLYAQQEPRHE